MALQIDQEYELVPIGEGDTLKEHPKNPNRGDEAVIEESIDENGFYGAIIAQRSTGYILAGNHRYRVAKRMGATHVPVLWRDVDDETALKILLVDNESAKKGIVDEATLEELLAGLETLRGTGYVLASAQEQIESGASPAPASAASAPVTPADVPEDRYTPQWGVMIACNSERQQEETYKWLRENLPKRELRVVAT